MLFSEHHRLCICDVTICSLSCEFLGAGSIHLLSESWIAISSSCGLLFGISIQLFCQSQSFCLGLTSIMRFFVAILINSCICF